VARRSLRYQTVAALDAGILDGSLLKARKPMYMNVHTGDWRHDLIGAAGDVREYMTGSTGGAPIAVVAKRFYLRFGGERRARLSAVGYAGSNASEWRLPGPPKSGADYWDDHYDLSEHPLIVDCMGEFAARIEFVSNCTVNAGFLVDVYVRGDILTEGGYLSPTFRKMWEEAAEDAEKLRAEHGR
jgi:hypothetical protein